MNEQKARELAADVIKLHRPDYPTAASERAPSEPQAQSARCSVADCSVAGKKLTKWQLGNVAAWLNSSRQLEKMTPRELIDECLKSDAANYDIVIELMNRVLPGWATDDTEDQPQNK